MGTVHAGVESMLPTSDHRFPVLRDHVAATGSRFARAAALCSGLAVAGLFAMGAGAPASAESYLQPKRTVVAPTGFAGVCKRYSWACAGGQGGSGRAEILQMAQTVNRSVNQSVTQAADQGQYGTAELWALPTGRGGDCEDFALLKKREMIRLGAPAGRLLIATVLDRQRQPHAVLVVRADEGDYILDNLTNRIMRWDRTGYSFIRMQDPTAPSRWAAVYAGGVFAANKL